MTRFANWLLRRLFRGQVWVYVTKRHARTPEPVPDALTPLDPRD
jgi:hypothetical protein